ncbi:hypothetical protein MPER_14427, partial [Moniliophthora perniciosa FA553]
TNVRTLWHEDLGTKVDSDIYALVQAQDGPIITEKEANQVIQNGSVQYFPLRICWENVNTAYNHRMATAFAHRYQQRFPQCNATADEVVTLWMNRMKVAQRALVKMEKAHLGEIDLEEKDRMNRSNTRRND